jgi:hypothetical protein
MKTVIGAIVATMAFATSMAFATTPYLPSPQVNISGSVIYLASTTNNGTTSKGTLKTVSFNTKSLIALLNASSAVQSTLSDLGLPPQIPAGSYFIFDMDNEGLIITNKNGFSFTLYAYDPVTSSYYDYGYLDFYEDALFGSYSLNDTTGAGSEQDQTGVEFYFWDGNSNELEPEYGNGAFNWTFGAVSGSLQKASVSVSMQPAGYYAEVNGSSRAITKGMNVSGSGSATVWSLGEPFYLWW